MCAQDWLWDMLNGGSKFDGETFWEETEADNEVINMEEDT